MTSTPLLPTLSGEEPSSIFNYTSIRRALKNPQEIIHMKTFFGEILYEEFNHKPKESLEDFVMEKMKEEFRKNGVKHIREFQIVIPNKNQIFYLIYLTESDLGLKIMKGVMKKLSTSKNKIGFNPNDKRGDFLFEMGETVEKYG